MTDLLRRSELALPACNDHMFAKAAGCGADLVFLDLEDATPVSLKVQSRAKAIKALNELDWGHTARAIRINGLDTPWCHDDLIEVVTGARENLDTVVIPKALTARDVWWVDVMLTQLEEKLGLSKKIRLEVLIEEVEGLANAEEIARGQPAAGCGDLRRRRLLAVPGRPSGHQLRPRWTRIRGTSGPTHATRSWSPPGSPASTRSTRPTRITRTWRAIRPRRDGRRCTATPASGPSTRRRSRSPTRCSPRPKQEVTLAETEHGRLPGGRGRWPRCGRRRGCAGRCRACEEGPGGTGSGGPDRHRCLKPLRRNCIPAGPLSDLSCRNAVSAPISRGPRPRRPPCCAATRRPRRSRGSSGRSPG